jgi:hypothetical protein
MNRIFLASLSQAVSLRERTAAQCPGIPGTTTMQRESLGIIDRWVALQGHSLPARLRVALKAKMHSQNMVLTGLFYIQLVFLRQIAGHI